MREMLHQHASVSLQLTSVREVLPRKRELADPTAFDHVVLKPSVKVGSATVFEFRPEDTMLGIATGWFSVALLTGVSWGYG